MPIIVGTIVVWIAVVIFCLVPKRLTAFETTFWAYGPMSYLFFYGLDYMGLKSGAVSFYIFSVVLIAVGLEWAGTLLGVYHYLNGYKLSYSMPIYFTVFSLWVMLYRYYRILAANGKL